jgi:replicative DNA helicase
MAKTDTVHASERSLPHNLEAEKKVLGAMMRDVEAVHRSHAILGNTAFYQPGHQKIYEILVELSARHTAIDLTTLSDVLERRGELNAVGGPYYLIELFQSVVSSANVEYHAAIVRERAVRRNLIRTCSEIMVDAYEGGDEAEQIVTRAEAGIFRLSQDRIGRSFTPVGKFLDIAIDKIQLAHEQKGALTGLSTGFRDLDRITTGLQPSDLIILAARPSVGKTSLVLNIAEYAAMEGTTVGVFSLEMSSEQIAERVLCS